MNLQEYHERRQELESQKKKWRDICLTCRQPDFRCYCPQVHPFDPAIKFVILIHPIEVKRPIATGRMSHLCLEDSELITGGNYSDNRQVTALINDPRYYPVILYPGESATNVTPLSSIERQNLFPQDKKLLIFVIDGTWNTARKTVKLSQNLIHLPQIFFSPPGPSNFRVRTQPNPECYSSIEAIHHTIELLGEGRGFDTASRRHDALLTVFNHMVEKQLAFVKKGTSRHRRHRK